MEQSNLQFQNQLSEQKKSIEFIKEQPNYYLDE